MPPPAPGVVVVAVVAPITELSWMRGVHYAAHPTETAQKAETMAVDEPLEMVLTRMSSSS